MCCAIEELRKCPHSAISQTPRLCGDYLVIKVLIKSLHAQTHAQDCLHSDSKVLRWIQDFCFDSWKIINKLLTPAAKGDSYNSLQKDTRCVCREVLSSGTRHSCKKASPGQSPWAVTVPWAWGWQGQPGSSQHSWQLHTAPWCQIPANSTPAQHCRGELALDIYCDQTWGCWEAIPSLLGKEPILLFWEPLPSLLSMNRARVWDAASCSDSKMCFCEGEFPWKHRETQPGEMGSWSSSVLSTVVLKGCQEQQLRMVSALKGKQC